MAAYSRREVTTVRVEYVLDSPTNWAEVDKAFASCRTDLGEQARWDDVVRVEARDDEVVISYELSKETL